MSLVDYASSDEEDLHLPHLQDESKQPQTNEAIKIEVQEERRRPIHNEFAYYEVSVLLRLYEVSVLLKKYLQPAEFGSIKARRKLHRDEAWRGLTYNKAGTENVIFICSLEVTGSLHVYSRSSDSSLTEQKEGVSSSPQALDLRLPDASLLLNSPSLPSHLLQPFDHTSRVAVATADSTRKRELKGPSSSYPRSKVPKGTLPHPKGAPDTAGGLLVPPQLTGRRNVVTEDISKLFVKKHVDSS